MANVKGSALAARVTWVRLNHGQAGFERLAAQASPGLAEVLAAGVTLARWYPIELLIETSETIDRLFGAGDGALVVELGRFAADAHLTTIYRLFFKVGTVRWVIGRAARLWHLHYDTGKLELTEQADAIVLELRDVATPSCTHCQSVRGWAERSVELSGGSEVASALTACRREGAAGCCVRLTWR